MSRENVRIVEGIYEQWERGDFSATDWADAEIEYRLAGPDRAAYRGIGEMGEAFAEWLRAWKDFSVEACEILDAGEKVVAIQVFRGTGRGSGFPIDEAPGAAVFTLRDGMVVAFEGYTDPDKALAESGIGSG